MSDYTKGPKYCPNCGKELSFNSSICASCDSKLKKEVNKSKRYKFTKRTRRIIGFIMICLTLPYIIFLGIIVYYPSLWYLFSHLHYEFLFLAFPLYFFGLGLIYFSFQTRIKGIFLIIFGYFLFYISFFIIPIIRYYDIRRIFFYLLFIDLPIILMILFGIFFAFKHNRIESKLYLSYIPVIFSNIFLYTQIFVGLGY